MQFLKTIANKLSTQFVIISALVVASTGVYMFYVTRWKQLEDLHSYVGIVFSVAMLFHILKNWKPTKRYFTKATVYGVLAAVAVFGAFVYIVIAPNAFSWRGTYGYLARSEMALVSQVFKIEKEVVAKRFDEAGIAYEYTDSLNEIAKKNNTRSIWLIRYFESDYQK